MVSSTVIPNVGGGISKASDKAEDKADRVQRMFSSISGRYDVLNTLLSLNRDEYWREFTSSCTELPSGGLALDVATGTGKLACQLARDNQVEVVGVDFCEDMLAEGKQRTSGAGVRLAVADAESLPFLDNVFDCATIGFTLRNVTDIDRTLSEMTRVVKVGGE